MSDANGLKDRRRPSVALIALILAFLLQMALSIFALGGMWQAQKDMGGRIDRLERSNDIRSK